MRESRYLWIKVLSPNNIFSDARNDIKIGDFGLGEKLL